MYSVEESIVLNDLSECTSQLMLDGWSEWDHGLKDSDIIMPMMTCKHFRPRSRVNYLEDLVSDVPS